MPPGSNSTRRSLVICVFLMAGASCTANVATPTGTGGASGAAGGVGTSGTGGGGGAGAGGAATGQGGVTGGGSGGTSGGATGSGGNGSPRSDAGIVDSGPAGDGGGLTAGCGATTWPMGGTANPQTLNVTTAGATIARQFYFALPTSYTSARPYRLVFAWHYAGGTALMVAGTGGGAGRYYGLQPLLPDTIFITGQGLTDAQGTTGWPNTNGQDIAFARAMVDWANANLCIDKTRVMSTGFSYGAIMSHTVACQMPDVFRAVGLMAGMLIGRATACVNHPIAAWMTHGTADTAAIGGVDFANGVTARDRIVALNHCAATTQPTTPSPCVAYDGCDAGEPVVWCPVEGEAHVIPSFAPAAIATFFSQF
jgi:polyhydroxybutyrate depolymerase